MTRAIVIVMVLLVGGCWYETTSSLYPVDRLELKDGWQYYKIRLPGDTLERTAREREKWIRKAVRDDGCDPDSLEIIDCESRLTSKGLLVQNSQHLYTVRAKPID